MERNLIGLQKDNFKFFVIYKKFEENYNVILEVHNEDFVGKMYFPSTSRYYASINYKNMVFRGRIILNSWRIWDEKLKNIVIKNGDNILFESNVNFEILKQKIERQNDEDDLLKYPAFKEIYDSVLKKYNKLFLEIQNKEKFIDSLKDYLFENGDFEFNDYDKIIGFNDCIYEDEKNSRDSIIESCLELFENFINSEKDNYKLLDLIKLDNLINYVPKLKKINYRDLKDVFKEWKDNNLDNYSIIDINYNRIDMLIDVANKLNELYKHKQRLKFEDDFDNYIVSLAGEKLKDINEKDEFYHKILSEFKGDEIPTDNSIIQTINKYMELVRKFNKQRNDLIDCFGTNEIILKIDDTFVNKIHNYEIGCLNLNDQELNEYNLVYKPLEEIYKMYCCKKNSNKPKLIIEGFDGFINYAKCVFNILIDNKFLIEEKGFLKVNDVDNIDFNKIIKLIKFIDI